MRVRLPLGAVEVVLCLQVLGRARDATAFPKKLFACADKLVMNSVPERWSSIAHQSRSHDFTCGCLCIESLSTIRCGSSSGGDSASIFFSNLIHS